MKIGSWSRQQELEESSEVSRIWSNDNYKQKLVVDRQYDIYEQEGYFVVQFMDKAVPENSWEESGFETQKEAVQYAVDWMRENEEGVRK